MPILTHELYTYLEGLRPESDPLMAAMEQFAQRDSIPIVHWDTGRLLAVLAGSLPPGSRVLEVGTAIGYSTLHIARALPASGRVVTIERDPVRVTQAREFLDRDPGGAGDRVEIVEADALDAIATIKGQFNMIFLDATKGEYKSYLELAEPKASDRALLTIDNVLMSGSVAFEDGVEVPDAFGSWWGAEQRRGARELNAELIESVQWLSVVLPVGDGVLFGVRA